MDITIRDDTWYVLNMQLTTKNRKDGIIMIFLVLAITKMQDPPAWFACGQHLRSLGMGK